jgi:hypothetical protein
MGAIAVMIGSIGGLAAVLGVLTATGIVEPLGQQFTWQFWFSLAAILLLGSIAFGVGRKGGFD